MAFNIMDLFGPGALNRLLQPAANTQGVQNMLMTRPDVQPAPVVAGVDPWQGMREEDVMRVDPMQTASAAQPVQQAQQPQQNAPAGLGGLISPDRKQFLQDMFLGWAAGATPSQSLALGAAQAVKGKSGRADQNQTVQFLKGKGMDEQSARLLASNPTALGDYLKNMNDPMQGLQAQKTQLEINKLKQGRPENYTPLTSEEKTQLGLDPSKAYQRGADNKISEIGGNGVNVNVEAPKLPSGYRFVDTKNPSAGVEPIPGGPATQLPGELAARIGLADSWLENDLPKIKESVKAGNVTGLYDRYQAANNQSSPQASTYRKIQSGVEVLSRLLSGAGMTQVEIDEKTARYLPTYTDDDKSMMDKVDQLETELRATKGMAMRGRGGSQPQAQPGAVVDYQEYFKGP